MLMPVKSEIRSKMLESVQVEAEIPAFSDTARRLMDTVNRPHADLASIAEIAKIDPGITSKFLRLASSPSFSARYITSIQDALMIIGLEQAQRLATTIVVMGRFTQMRVRIDWELFWVHCVLTANLAHRLTSSFRVPDGREYLAGLLHDIGKLYIGHHFPHEFERVVLRAMVVGQGMHHAELECFDITHSQVAGLLCEKWKLQPDVVHAVNNHHESDLLDPEIELKEQANNFLATVVYLADRMANITRVNIQGAETIKGIRFQDLPEWSKLGKFPQIKPLEIDLTVELRIARDIISSVKDPTQSRIEK